MGVRISWLSVVRNSVLSRLASRAASSEAASSPALIRLTSRARSVRTRSVTSTPTAMQPETALASGCEAGMDGSP